MSKVELARALTLTVFMASGLKSDENKLSIIITGEDSGQKIVTAANGALDVKGYLTNQEDKTFIKENGSYDISKALGKNGFLEVVKDTGDKIPYSSKCKLLTGQISDDFAYYFTMSESRPLAIVCGEEILEDFVKSVAMIVEPMPNCPDEIITIVEDILTQFGSFNDMIKKYSVNEIFEKYFGHFDYKLLNGKDFRYKCDCSQKKIDDLLIGLGRKEIEDILDNQDKIEIKCEFCNKNYVYGREEAIRLFENDN